MIYQNTFGGKWVWDPANPFNVSSARVPLGCRALTRVERRPSELLDTFVESELDLGCGQDLWCQSRRMARNGFVI